MQNDSTTYGVPSHWDEETDVAIIGSGYAGLAAAVEACNADAEVVILEKMPYYGGNSIISGGGYCSSDSKLKLREKLGLGEDSWQLHMRDTIKGGADLSLPELVEVLAKNAPDGINLFIDLGVKYAGTLPLMGGHSAYRSYLPVNNKGIELSDPLRDHALSKGAELRLNTAVTRIWRADDSSPASGLSIESGGVTRNLRVRRALVIASGGFARDLEMRQRYNPQLTAAYNCSNHRGATGECIRYAQAIGADVIHMNYIQLFPTANPANGLLDKYALCAYSGTGFGVINVNKNGVRFTNELGGRDEVSDAQISTCEKPTYSILNRKIIETLDVPQSVISEGIASGRIIASETAGGLADELGAPVLPATIEAHNGYIREQKDPEFGKQMNAHMLPINQAPYYAIPQWPTVHFCMGGLRFDADAQVLDVNGSPIPRLYAAGECCGGIHGANRLAGNAIAECMVFGRIAGAGAGSETTV